MKTFIIEMTKSDLEHLIQEQIKEVFHSKHKDVAHKKTSESKYLSRKETASLLKVSLPTLNKLTKQSKLVSYKLGNRVLYKRDEVEKALIPIVNSKFKRE